MSAACARSPSCGSRALCDSRSDVWPGTFRFERSPLISRILQVHRKGDVRHAAAEQRGAAGQMRDVLDVRRAHDADAVFGDVGKHLVQLDILLRPRPNEIVYGMPVIANTGCPSSLAS